MTSNYSRHLDELVFRFPGQAVIRLVDAGRLLGFAPATTRKKKCSGEFPIRVIETGGAAPLVTLVDLAAFLSGETPPAPKLRQRFTSWGRPSAEEEAEARKNGFSSAKEMRQAAKKQKLSLLHRGDQCHR